MFANGGIILCINRPTKINIKIFYCTKINTLFPIDLRLLGLYTDRRILFLRYFSLVILEDHTQL